MSTISPWYSQAFATFAISLSQAACDTLVIGAGIIGISTAYYLKQQDPHLSIILLDAGQPMAFTSAQSGENYRNWWPHPVMTAFTDRSITLMEQIAAKTQNRINMSRRGYVLATRSEQVDALLDELSAGYSRASDNLIRVHEDPAGASYEPPISDNWASAPGGVDVIRNPALIQNTFPSYAGDIQSVVHIRRAGSISSQQMGQHMLEAIKALGGVRITGRVKSIDTSAGFNTHLENTTESIQSDRIVNAAGPFINDIARHLGTELPVTNTLQQKIAFEDKIAAIPRQMPFSIDLDGQFIDWDDEEKELLSAESTVSWLVEKMPGSIHCRPDGGDNGTWVKLGWAYNELEVQPMQSPILTDEFPEIVLRGAAKLNPSLQAYYGNFPANMHHYGGYYTLTNENWPLIGEMAIKDTYVVGAMSGFGTMAACAGGELCAQWVLGNDLPDYAHALSPQRYSDNALMKELAQLSSRGIL